MKYQRFLMFAALVAGCCLLIAPDSFGQRRGGAVGGARPAGGAIAGGARPAVAARPAGGASVTGPLGGGASAVRSSGSVIGPAGRSATAGSASGSINTKGGGTINYAGAGAGATGPAGGSAGRVVGGVQLNTAGGKTITKAGTAGGAVGAGGAAIGGKSSITTGQGQAGRAASISKSGAAIGPGGAAASRAASATGVASGISTNQGRIVGGSNFGVATGPNGLGGYTSVRGAATVGHRTTFVAANTLRYNGVAVRNNFVHYNAFRPAWFTSHPNAWRVAAWPAATFWAGATWGYLASWCRYPVQPIIYDYGTAIVYEGDQVYYDGEPVATAEQYSQQAAQIAVQGQDAKVADTEEWSSLGVFGMVQGDEKDANNIFQLAINKDGIIRGNYYNAISDTTVPVYGSVDKSSQRAAWIVGDRKDTIYETGIANLTQPETSLLVHFGTDRTQQWTLVRMDPPKD